MAKKKIDKKILNSYVPADTHCWINEDDPDLKPIRIPLPKAPPIETIDGYGLPAEDQVFKYEEYPKKLRSLENRIKKEVKDEYDSKSGKYIEKMLLERLWQYLSNHRDDYKDEILWMKKQWYYRLYGYWFFCNGKPTYLTGWNWSYLNYCKLQGVVERNGLPEYRDRDRRWFNAQWYFYSDTTSIAYEIVKKKGENVRQPLYNEDGSFKLLDMGTRTVYGTNNLKARRVGETSKTGWINIELATRLKEYMGGIQGDADATGKTVFTKHVVYPYRRMPWFFKPQSPSNLDPKQEIIFEGDDLDLSLGSKVDYATTVHRNFYDSNRLDFYHSDEGGKVYREDVRKRHLVVKTCLVRGSVIKGFTIYTSTVGEMDGSSAGDKFLELTQDSHYEQRNNNGQTKSGLVNIFFSAADGLDGFIGKYGESIINNPTPEQIEHMKTKVKINGRVIGAKEYIENRRKPYLESEDYELLSNEKREYPLIFRECFTPPASAMLWNINKLEKRLHELRFRYDKPVRQGNFRWIEGFGGPVEFIDTDSGRWFMSHEPPIHLRNNRYQQGRLWFPGNADKYIASADPYQHEKTQDGRRSDGGGAVRHMRDYEVDPEDSDRFYLKSEKPVCTYRYRPSSRTMYAEDMLMMSIYYGALMYPEHNIPLIIDKFTEWGYKGYFLYDIDPLKRKKKDKPGWHTGDKTEMFGLMADDIDANCHRWDHEDLIKECLAIKRMEDLTKFDLLAAYMGTLVGEKSKYTQKVARGNELKVNLGALSIPKIK